MENKCCSECKKVKNLSQFHWNNKAQNKRHNYCKMCRVSESKTRYIKHRKKIDEQNKKYNRLHPYNRRAIIEKYRCKQKGLAEHFTWIEWENLLLKQQKRCNICGKKKALEVDHIIPLIRNGSNTIDNIQGLCRLCNTRKGFSNGHNLKETYEQTK